MNEAEFLGEELDAMQNAYELASMVMDPTAQRLFDLPMQRLAEVAGRIEERLDALRSEP